MHAFNQPHLMGPINFVFNDYDRITKVMPYEKNIMWYMKSMVDRVRDENGKKYSTGYLTEKVEP
jgi:hypothetical protein